MSSKGSVDADKLDKELFVGELGPENRYKYLFHEPELVQIQALLTGSEDNEAINSDEELCDHGEDILIDDNFGLPEDSEDDVTDPEIDDEAENDNVTANQEIWLTQHPKTKAPAASSRDDSVHIPSGVTTAYDYFKLFFTEELLQEIVMATNKCAADTLVDNSMSETWKELDIAELRIFLGLLLAMGSMRLSMTDYWKTNSFYPTFAIKCMARNRFLAIFRFLKFGKENLNTLINHFNKTMDALFTPGTDLLIYESLMLRTGRDEIALIIDGKRERYGIELYTLATPSAVTVQMHMCQRLRDEEAVQDADKEVDGERFCEKIIKKLMSKFLNAEHHLFLSDHYNSVSLAEFLLENKTYVTGPLRNYREGNPREVCQSKLRKGASVHRYTPSGVCVCKWRGPDRTFMISSIWSPELVPVIKKGRKIVHKPDIVEQFDEFLKRVVDNEMYEYYAFKFKGMRWYKKVGIHIIQIMFANAYYLYKTHNNLNLSYHDYRSALMKTLLHMLSTSNAGSKRKRHRKRETSATSD